MRIALVQQYAGHDRMENIDRGLLALRNAAEAGAEIICYAELAFERFYPQYRAESSVVERAETIPGPMTDTFAGLARELGVVVAQGKLNEFLAEAKELGF
ncbi:nitrilase-related carbon-nitrogen hydrolase, partial [Gemmatimonadota bacterium]